MSIVQISARLWPALRIGDSWVSVNPTNRVNRDGKPEWQWAVDAPEWEDEGAELWGWGNAGEMLSTLCSFLGAAAESYRHSMSQNIPLSDTENGEIFSARVAEWCYQNEDDISMAQWELNEAAEEDE